MHPTFTGTIMLRPIFESRYLFKKKAEQLAEDGATCGEAKGP